ncbi:universal stress protein [Sutcliffiella halmapala]|uniref:universal stress protein n=1 Tax=Sutcliffiella halmapala TaxID=79882 RepID=UPI000994FB45|nr:universal stress protein [Sutcliffiella halmapala]
MHTFNNVLIAYDGSEGSKRAVRIGISMKKKLNTNITLLHVLEERMTGAPIQTRQPEGFAAGGYGLEGLNMYAPNAKHRVPNEQHLQGSNYDPAENSVTKMQELLAQEHVDAPVEIVIGDAAKSICHFAETNNNDLIIIGSRGLGGLKKLILGSVSDKVTNSANCPVLVAK